MIKNLISVDVKHGSLEDTFMPQSVLGGDWNRLLGDGFIKSKYFSNLLLYAKSIYKLEETKGIIEPSSFLDIFNPYKLTLVDDIKVVIIGDKPYPNSNGFLFGQQFSQSHQSSALMQTHVKLFGKSNVNYVFDESLEDWSQEGVLGLNYNPIYVRNSRALENSSSVFKVLYVRTLQALLNKNPNLVVAVTSSACMDIVNIAKIPMSNVIVGNGYLSTIREPAKNIYSRINEKLTELFVEPVEF